MKAPFCMAPWVSAFSDFEGYRPCCMYGPTESKIISLSEYWNSTELKTIRSEFMHAKIPSRCKEICFYNVGMFSISNASSFDSSFGYKKQNVIKNTTPDGHYSGHPIEYNIIVNNICTLKCRMCDSRFSSSIQAETGDIIPNSKNISLNYKRDLLHALKHDHIESIVWTGGEPLSNPIHWEIMHALLDKGKTDIMVRYTTNLSSLFFKDYNFLELIRQFSNIKIACSMDAVGELAEYLRYGIKFEEWHDNYKSIVDIVGRKMQLLHILSQYLD